MQKIQIFMINVISLCFEFIYVSLVTDGSQLKCFK
jgi:hypothetical protein